jgi:hypothetical protein
MQTKTISKTAFARALSLARAHGHMWASHVEYPAVVAILAGPEPCDAAALTEAFSWAAAEDDQRVGGIGFSLSHTTSTGRLSWSVCPVGVSQGPYDTAPAAGDVDLTVSRPSLAWRVWSAQRRAAWAAESDDRRVGAEIMRMLAPEPERGSMDVLKIRIPAADLAKPRWLVSPEIQDIGVRHLRVLAEAAHALGGTAELDALFGLVGELGDSLPANEFDAAGIVMSQAIDSDGRVITLDMWGQAHLDIHLFSASTNEPLDYVDTGIWTRRNRSEFLRQLATPAFVERIVDRLMSWAGMDLARACQTAELALAEVDAAAIVRPITGDDGPWSVKVIRPAPTTGPIVSGRATVDELPVIFSSED